MLRLNCFIQVSNENRAEVLAAARRLTEASLKQEGCVAYDIFESATRPETWRDQAALDAHSASAEFEKEVGYMRDHAAMKLETFTF